MWVLYTQYKQTYDQIAEHYSCSRRTVQRYLDKVKVNTEVSVILPISAVILIDTTYFGRSFGVIVFKDAASGLVLYKKYVKYETNALYMEGILYLEQQGVKILGVVCDGRKGLILMLTKHGLLVQMCQFHQIQVVNRYLTKKPKSEAAKELRDISLKISTLTEDIFTLLVIQWFAKWAVFINEKSEAELSKKRYKHRKLRSAYFSLKRNLKYLFVYQKTTDLIFPNTTNALDGSFADLKNKLRNHNGLNMKRKKRFIDEFFKA